ncbi:hypothetical protein [Fructobacillus tropaeoli]|uniref:hypothetical protein n=1 Tax=Fructobacillus tropaeoli TaxID=709323 RepID=UPI001940452D|nr:hypothetical protein [Fructobacillus tropaeoli]GIC70602.1 hypothetical protein FT12353_12780 [Fructobacillus tropaeoli]
MKRHKEQATAVNKQFATVTDERPEKHDYRHANMRDGFRNGAINYGKHMRWMNEIITQYSLAFFIISIPIFIWFYFVYKWLKK